MPCRLIVIRQVLGLKCRVPVPLECAILNEPFGNTAVSTLLPRWSTPPAVNTPRAMMLEADDVADVDMSWNRSVPEALARAVCGAAAAAATPDTAIAPAAATAPAAPSSRLRTFSMLILPQTGWQMVPGADAGNPDARDTTDTARGP